MTTSTASSTAGTTLALLHTTAVTVPALSALAAGELPGVRVVNLLDDSLLADVMTAGAPTDAVERRMDAYVAQARVLGAAAVLCCCSSVGDVAERIAERVAPFPVWRIDAAMAERAAEIGGCIAVMATVRTTLEPTARLIARAAGSKEHRIEPVVVEGAFERLRAGDVDAHDALVRAALERVLASSDVVVLAQASMARIVPTLPSAPTIPVLTSPPLAFARLRSGLRSLTQKP